MCTPTMARSGERQRRLAVRGWSGPHLGCSATDFASGLASLCLQVHEARCAGLGNGALAILKGVLMHRKASWSQAAAAQHPAIADTPERCGGEDALRAHRRRGRDGRPSASSRHKSTAAPRGSRAQRPALSAARTACLAHSRLPTPRGGALTGRCVAPGAVASGNGTPQPAAQRPAARRARLRLGHRCTAACMGPGSWAALAAPPAPLGCRE